MENEARYLELTLRVLEEEATEEERQELERWLQAAPENRESFHEIARIWRAARSQSPKSTPEVDAAWRELSAKLEAPPGTQAKVFQRRKLKPIGWVRNLGFAAGLAALALVVYSSYRLSLPPYYELAVLRDWEQKSLATATRGEPGLADDYTLAAQALLAAPRKRWGLVPYFDHQQVRLAMTHLQRAFDHSSDAMARNKYAYFLAKAHLMRGEADPAKAWLRRVLASEAAAYQREAKELLQRMETSLAD